MVRTNSFTNTYLDRCPFVQLVKIKSEHYKHNILGGLFTNSISKSTVQKSIGKDLDETGCGLRGVLSHNLPGGTKQVKKTTANHNTLHILTGFVMLHVSAGLQYILHRDHHSFVG